MKIAQIEIVNFRSIKELVLMPKELNALIGKNSSGKTNILKAIDLVIGEGWTTKAKIARELFNDVTKEIFIKIDFSSPLSTEWYQGRQLNVNTVTLKMKFEPLECQVKMWENFPNDFNGNGYSITEDFKSRYQFIYIPADRNLSDELRVSNWTLLGKMMKMVYNDYVSHKGNEESLKEEFNELMQKPKEFLEHDFSPGTDRTSFKKFHDIFQKHCNTNSSGLAEGIQPILNVYNINWFYKTLQITVKESYTDQFFDVEQLGSGVQNLVMLSIFQTYAELQRGNVIFGFEEPELFLYPHAQRNLYKNFIELSSLSQIFYTTHNPNFINAFRAYDITRVYKDAKQGTAIYEKNAKYVTPDMFEDKKYQIYTHFNTERNELFFADFVVLVEGLSDKVLLQNLIELKWGMDLNKHGISIVDCGGKNGVAYFVGVCRLMGINNFFAMWDSDDEPAESRNAQLQFCVENANGIELVPNLEKHLAGLDVGYKFSNSSNKIECAAEWSNEVETQNIPNLFDPLYAALKTVTS